jgi:hypothetical protein
VFLEIWDEIEKMPQPENRMEAIKAAMEKHDGSMTNAILFPECIVIAKHSNPCFFAYVPSLKCILFASTDTMLEKALGCVLEPTFTIFRPFNIAEMKNDTILKIDDSGVTLGGPMDIGKFKTQTASEQRWMDYGTCEPPTEAPKGKVVFSWEPGKVSFEKPETTVRPPPVLTAEEAEKAVSRAMLKGGDLVRDLEGWNLKYLVVYSVVNDGIWGLFGATPGEAKKAFMAEKDWKPSTKGGNIKWTKSNKFLILERGLTRAGIPQTPIKQSPPESRSPISARVLGHIKVERGDVVETSASPKYFLVSNFPISGGIEGWGGSSIKKAQERDHPGFIADEIVVRVVRPAQTQEPEVLSTYIPVATDQKLDEDWERYLYGGEEAGN